jgi:hypothetical protein
VARRADKRRAGIPVDVEQVSDHVNMFVVVVGTVASWRRAEHVR